MRYSILFLSIFWASQSYGQKIQPAPNRTKSAGTYAEPHGTALPNRDSRQHDYADKTAAAGIKSTAIAKKVASRRADKAPKQTPAGDPRTHTKHAGAVEHLNDSSKQQRHGAAGKSKQCKLDEYQICTDNDITYQLNENERIVNISTYCQLANPTVVHIPKGAKLDNFINGNPKFLEVKKIEDQNLLSITPVLQSGAQITSEQINRRLVKATLHLQISTPATSFSVVLVLNLSAKTVTRNLIFVDKKLEKQLSNIDSICAQKYEAQKEKLEEQSKEIEEKSNKVVNRFNGNVVMNEERIYCTDLTRWNRKMNDLLELRAKRICQIGKRIHLSVEIKNLARDLCVVGDLLVSVRNADGESETIEPQIGWKNDKPPRIEYKQSIRGVLIFNAPQFASKYNIELTEAGGKKRKVMLRGVGF